MLPYRWTVIARLARARRRERLGARRACRARSSPRSTSRWTRSTCASRRACRSRTPPRSSSAMGKALSRRSSPRGRSRWSIANIGMPQNARSAPRRAPTSRPQHGLPPARSSRDPEERKHLAGASSPRRPRDDPHARLPRRRVARSPLAGSWPASSPTATRRRRGRGPRREPGRARQRGAARSPTSRAPSPASATCTSRCSSTTRRSTSTRDREKAGLRGRDARATPRRRRSRRRSATSTRPASGSTPHNGQSYYVVTSYDGDEVADTQALGALPVRVSARGQAGAPRRLRRHPPRSSGPIAVERNHLAARRPRAHADRGARHRQRRAAISRPRLQGDPRTRDIDWSSSSARWTLMRTTFSGLGLALGLAVMVVFMIMASQFKSLRLPVRHAVHHPGLARRDRPRADGRRAGVLDHGADGHPDGHRHRRLQRHPARRRRQPPVHTRASTRSTPSSPRRARASCRSR